MLLHRFLGDLTRGLIGLFFFILTFLCTSPCSALPNDEVILTTHDLYPYGSYPEKSLNKVIADDSFKGVAVDVVKCVLGKMKTPFKIHVVPWKRAQFLVQHGKADGFFAASQKDSRDEYAVMSAKIADQKWNWYLLKDNPLNPQEKTFKENATVGGFQGANMLEWLQENNFNVVVEPNDTETLLKVLLAKRVDAIMANNYVMEALLKKEGATQQVKSYVNKYKPLAVYFSKEYLATHPGFIDVFNSYVPMCRK